MGKEKFGLPIRTPVNKKFRSNIWGHFNIWGQINFWGQLFFEKSNIWGHFNFWGQKCPQMLLLSPDVTLSPDVKMSPDVTISILHVSEQGVGQSVLYNF